jgi:hypothetical protein
VLSRQAATTGYQASIANLARVTLQDDNVFGDDDGATQLGTVTGDVASGYTVALTVGVDTATKPTGGSMPGGDGGPSGAWAVPVAPAGPVARRPAAPARAAPRPDRHDRWRCLLTGASATTVFPPLSRVAATTN